MLDAGSKSSTQRNTYCWDVLGLLQLNSTKGRFPGVTLLLDSAYTTQINSLGDNTPGETIARETSCFMLLLTHLCLNFGFQHVTFCPHSYEINYIFIRVKQVVDAYM